MNENLSYLTTNEIATDLGLGLRAVQKYCKEGYLPAYITTIKGKRTYVVDVSKYKKWKTKHFNGVQTEQISKKLDQERPLNKEELMELSVEWLNWCATGMLTGKVLSPRTVDMYKLYFELFCKKLDHRCDMRFHPLKR